MGDNYTPKSIEKRIAEQKAKNITIFSGQYYTIVADIKKTAGAYRDTSSVNDTCGRYMKMYQIITQEKIESIGMVQSRLTKFEKKYIEIEQSVMELKGKIDTLTEEINSANYYFDDMGIMQRRFPKNEQDKAAAFVIKKYVLKHKEEITALSDKLEKQNYELAELMDKLSSAGGEVQRNIRHLQ